MLFGSKETSFKMIVKDKINVFEANTEVTIDVFDEYIKVASSTHNLNLFYGRIAECKEVEGGIVLVYYNAKKERKELYLVDVNGSAKKVVKSIKKYM